MRGVTSNLASVSATNNHRGSWTCNTAYRLFYVRRHKLHFSKIEAGENVQFVVFHRYGTSDNATNGSTPFDVTIISNIPTIKTAIYNNIVRFTHNAACTIIATSPRHNIQVSTFINFTIEHQACNASSHSLALYLIAISRIIIVS